LETLGYINIAGLDSIYSYTLNDLQSEWHIGVIFGTLSLVWAIIFLNAYQSKLAWKLPKL
jgi:hypothetical protein